MIQLILITEIQWHNFSFSMEEFSVKGHQNIQLYYFLYFIVNSPKYKMLYLYAELILTVMIYLGAPDTVLNYYCSET